MNAPRLPAAVALAVVRDQWQCVRCHRDTAGVIGHGWDVIRRLDSVRPGHLTPQKLDHAANLITVCGSGTYGCAGHIRRADFAYESRFLGYVVDRDCCPAEVPVLIDTDWVLLADDGTTTAATAPLIGATP